MDFDLRERFEDVFHSVRVPFPKALMVKPLVGDTFGQGGSLAERREDLARRGPHTPRTVPRSK